MERKNQNVSIDIKIISTKGDKILDIALSKIGNKNLFTKELEVQLLEKKIDMAVHSLKDLQTTIPKGLKLAAVTKRHNAQDVLIARRKGITLNDLKEGTTIATGSLRRECQLLHFRPDVKVAELRGNVPTRIERFLKSDWDGIILACAGVERLKMNKYISSYISTDGIEIHKENYFAEELVKTIHHENTYCAVMAERALLKTLEGGCQVPIGAFAEVKPNGLYLDAMVGSLDGTITFRKRARGSKYYPEKLGKSVAKDLLNAGAKIILNEINNSSG